MSLHNKKCKIKLRQDMKKLLADALTIKQTYNFETKSESKNENKITTLKAQNAKIIKSIVREGFVAPTIKCIYDPKLERFVIMDTSGAKYFKRKNNDITRMINSGFRKYAIGKTPTSNTIPMLLLGFNPKSDKRYNKHGMEYYNSFHPTPYMTKYKDAPKHKDILFYKRFKHINILLNNTFPIEEHRHFFLKWLSYGFQHLSKNRTAIISKGIEGTGKGILFEEIVKKFYGAVYVSSISNEHVISNFTSLLDNKLFVVANEVKVDRKQGNVPYERLKQWVTEPSVSINIKGIPEFEQDSFFNMWFHTNNSTPIQITDTDRRYSVFPTSDKKLLQIISVPIETFIDFVRLEVDDFIRDLYTLDVSYEDIKEPLMTEEKVRVVEATTSRLDQFFGWLKHGKIDKFIESFGDILEISDEVKDTLLDELQESYYEGYIGNALLQRLYRIFVNENVSSRKIGIDANTHLGKTARATIKGKRDRVRKICKLDKPVEQLSNEDKAILAGFESMETATLKGMLEGSIVSFYNDAILERVIELRDLELS